MTIWGDYIVVVRSYDVQLFTRPSSSPPRLLKTFEFGRFVWEVVIIHGSSKKESLEGIFPRNVGEDADNVISFLITHEYDAFLYVIELDLSFYAQSPHDNLTMRLIRTYELTHDWMHPAWHLRVGLTGHRITWISGGRKKNVDSPVLLSSNLNFDGSGVCDADDFVPLLQAEIDIGNAETFPALWAFPQFDFDEALGVLVLGNVFGELAVCDYVGRWSDELSLLAKDISSTGAQSFSGLPFVCTRLPNFENNCTDSYRTDRCLYQWIYQSSFTNLQAVVCLTQRHSTQYMHHGIP
jgi:hypothetical protein